MGVKIYKMLTEIIIGKGSSGKLGEKVKELNAKKAFIVTDKGIVSMGILKEILTSLQKENVEYELFDEVEPDPSTDMIEPATELAMKSNCDIIIGIGGGSSMDSAKAIGAMVTNEGKIEDYIGVCKIKIKPLPIIAIPTTAGSGSEVTFWSVLVEKKSNFKVGIGSWYLTPKIAIIDPLLCKSLPPKVTAFTGMDALTHAIESYVSKETQPISEALAIHSIKLIVRSLKKAFSDGANIDAREDMMMASTIAGMAFNVSKCGLAHALASPLGGHFHISHGMANAIVLPYVMKFNILAIPEKFAEIAVIFKENIAGSSKINAGMKAVNAVKKLMKDIGIIEGLKAYGVKEGDLRTIAEEAYISGNIVINPRESTVNDLIEILREAMNGLK